MKKNNGERGFIKELDKPKSVSQKKQPFTWAKPVAPVTRVSDDNTIKRIQHKREAKKGESTFVAETAKFIENRRTK